MTRRTIVITGASDGIGAAAARRLSRSGANVVVVGRSETKTIAVAEELGADYLVADFSDLSQVRGIGRQDTLGAPAHRRVGKQCRGYGQRSRNDSGRP